MREFFTAAFPWIITGLCVAVLAVQACWKKSGRNTGKKKGGTDNFRAEGMCLGMCLGTALETSFGSNTGIGLSMGMLVGLVIGTCIKKGEDDEENDGKPDQES